jgi:hypothetical protein
MISPSQALSIAFAGSAGRFDFVWLSSDTCLEVLHCIGNIFMQKRSWRDWKLGIALWKSPLW